jgi:hypothetical protein
MLLSNHHTGQSLERMKPKIPKVEFSISYEQRVFLLSQVKEGEKYKRVDNCSSDI